MASGNLLWLTCQVVPCSTTTLCMSQYMFGGPCHTVFGHLLQSPPRWLILHMSADAQNDIRNLTNTARTFFTRSEMRPPLGHDPTFQPASRLWDYDLIAREGEYYNTSQVYTCVSMSLPLCSATWTLRGQLRYSLMHSPTHSPTPSPPHTHPFACSLTDSIPPSLPPSLPHAPIHTHTCTQPVIPSSIHHIIYT